LERLADLIRPAIAYRPGTSVGEPPPGAADGEGFVVTVAMTSLTGCSGEAFASILRSLGYASVQREGPAITVPIIPAAPTQPVAVVEAAAEQATADIPLEVDGEALATAPIAAEATPVVEAAEETAGAVEPPPAEAAAVEATEAPADGTVLVEAAEAVAEEEAPAAPEPPPQIEVWTLQPRPAAQQHRPVPHEGRRREGGFQRPPRAEAGGPQPGPRPDEAQQARPPQERREDRSRFEAPRSGHRSGGKPGQGPRTDRPFRDDGRREGRQSEGFHAPRPRERQPDPDSPFAKLAALKAELEKKGKS